MVKKQSSIIMELEHEITVKDTFENRINLIVSYIHKFTGSDRCSIFVYQSDTNQLQSIYSDGMPTITLNSNTGLVGYAFHKRETVLENDTYASKYFYKGVDKKSGYTTVSILAVPIIDKHNKRLGAIQLLNKPGGFNAWDKDFIEALRKLLIPLIDSTKQVRDNHKSVHLDKGNIEDKLDSYLQDKKLYLMADEYAYYKVLEMHREYFIGADQLYLLNEVPKMIPLCYFSIDGEFMSVEKYMKVDRNANGLFIKELDNAENFTFLDLEKDE